MRDWLICYCGAEVTCYHRDCLALANDDPSYKEQHDRLYNGGPSVAPIRANRRGP
jgi:hypothetical protein